MFSDHLGLLRVYEGYRRALARGASAASQFCRNNFLSAETLGSMDQVNTLTLTLTLTSFSTETLGSMDQALRLRVPPSALRSRSRSPPLAFDPSRSARAHSS